ncbi:hypothetical protein GMSM_21200 [Geomonas sp. Red276]
MKRVYLCLGAALLALPACSNHPEGVNMNQVTALSTEKYAVSGVLADASGAPISGTVTLSATDPNGNHVNVYSDRTGGTVLTNATVGANGLVSFYVSSNATLPVTVTAIGNATGRVSSSAQVTITSVGSYSFVVKLVDPNNASATPGLAAATSAPVAASATTGLAAPITANVAPTDTATRSAAQVTIPASTILRDASGNALSGTVTATVTTFAPPTAALSSSNIANSTPMENFPGGLTNVSVAANQNTGATAGSFATAGFVAVNVTDSTGKVARSANTPFTIRMDIPAGTINPETGAAVAAGDQVPIWTYNETTATWKAEVDSQGNQVLGTVLQDQSGKLFVNYTTNHFSYWNLDWMYSNTCTGVLNLTNDAQKLALTVKAAFHNGAGFLYRGSKPSGDGSVTAFRIPAGQKLDLYLIDSANNVVASTTANSPNGIDWCAQPNHAISLDYVAPAALKPIPTTITVLEYCTQDPSVTRAVPSGQVMAMNTASYANVSGATGTDGTYTFNLLPGNYSFFAYDRTNKTWGAKTMAVSGSSAAVTIQSPINCQTTTGTGSTGSTIN